VRQHALIPSFLPVDVLANLIAVNQTDPYDSGSSDGVNGTPARALTKREPLTAASLRVMLCPARKFVLVGRVQILRCAFCR
jgi:hypothetical protein